MFPIRNDLKEGDALSPLLFKFALEYAIKRFRINQDSLKLNGKHQLMFYADDVNKLGGSIHAMKDKAESVVLASNEIGLQLNADNTKNMVMSQVQNAGRSHNKKIDNRSLEIVVESKYLGTNLSHKNSIQEEIKSRMKSGNARYNSVQLKSNGDGTSPSCKPFLIGNMSDIFFPTLTPLYVSVRHNFISLTILMVIPNSVTIIYKTSLLIES
jgi:hypothetical protein